VHLAGRVDLATAVIKAKNTTEAICNIVEVLNDVLESENSAVNPFCELEFCGDDGELEMIGIELQILLMRRWAPKTEQRTFWKHTHVLHKFASDETNNHVVIKDGVLLLRNCQSYFSKNSTLQTLYCWFSSILGRKNIDNGNWEYHPTEGSYSYSVLEAMKVTFDCTRYNMIYEADQDETAREKIVKKSKGNNEVKGFSLDKLWKEDRDQT
jgi:hypothetical protein